MKKQSDHKNITASEIQKALDGGATSMTAIAKKLGFKSGSTSILKRISAAMPDVGAQLIANCRKQESKNTPASTAAYTIPDSTPYRRTSGYAQVFSILFHHKNGISKSDLLAKYKAWSGKPDKNCGFDVHVVCSSKEDGSSHRSAAKAAQSYWVERAGDLLKLRLVGEAKK